MKTLTYHTTPSWELSQLTPCGDYDGKFSVEAHKLFLRYEEEDLNRIIHFGSQTWVDIMTDGTKVYAVWAEGPLRMENELVLLLELEYSDCEKAFNEATVLYKNILESLKIVVSEGYHVCDNSQNFKEFAEANGGYDPDFCKVVFDQNADELEAIYYLSQEAIYYLSQESVYYSSKNHK